MKLLTINTHSIIEPNYESKLDLFAEKIAEYKPDIIGMQEVNQSSSANFAKNLMGFMPCISKLVREDNHALRTVMKLKQKDINYYWTWVPVKIGYGKYEEGLAFLSRFPINSACSIYISNDTDYLNWKTRRMLGITVSAGQFFNVHTGWWNDCEEPFSEQWKKINGYIKGDSWLMGDFNSPDDIRNEGYDLITGSGWKDLYSHAALHDEGYTVTSRIDGWNVDKKQRIDYIFCNFDTKIKYVRTIFKHSPVSDHLGVMAEVDDYSISYIR